MKKDVFVYGMPSRYIFTEEEVLAMPILSASQRWDRRDSGDPDLKIETFVKKNGHLNISIKRFDGIARWTSYGTYSSERVEVSPSGRTLKR